MNDLSGLIYFPPPLMKASLQRVVGKINNPAATGGPVIHVCGERGIRTPGTVTRTAV